MRALSSILELYEEGYRGFLLDQFGVLHDGVTPYPGAVDAVRSLAEAGASLVLVSNSSQRAMNVWKRLEPMGFLPSYFVGVITSGELANEAFATRGEGVGPLAGHKDVSRVIHFTWAERGKISLDGLNLECTTEAAEAEIVLASGVDAMGTRDGPPTPRSLDELKEIARKCAERDLPIVIANPDYVTVAGAQDGKPLAEMPGAFMKVYESCGKKDRILCMGKPGTFMFERGVATLQAHNDALTLENIVMVGDSLHHDITGAKSANVHSVWVLNGIHADDISQKGAEATVAAEGVALPEFTMSEFR